MTLPGIITGQPISGQQFGQAILNFLPAFPGEGPPFMPRVVAKALFPQGFVPGRFPAAPAYPALVPPAVIPPVLPVRPTPPANQVGNHPRPPAQPAPRARKRVLERGSFPEWH